MKPTALAERHTTEELADMARKLREAHRIPRSERDGIEMYPPKVKKKLDAISWAITYRLKAGRE